MDVDEEEEEAADDDDDDDDDEEEGDDVIYLRGLSPSGATNRRIEVIWIEYEGKGRKRKRVRNPYSGFVVSVDLKKGLCVQLDGFENEEYLVTDEDEWSWLPGTEEEDVEMEEEESMADGGALRRSGRKAARR